MYQLFILTLIIGVVCSHSWMSCPPSFNPAGSRAGIQNNVCETVNSGSPVTEVYAGDRLKVGWTSNNHAGGYVRLALVKFGEHYSRERFRVNILKFACYGHDSRPKKVSASGNGDCKHPCDARPGCQFQSEVEDYERYDTTIGIPTNLVEGDYVLQAAMLLGNAVKPYYSCAKLRILEGNPNFNCKSDKPPVSYDCFKSKSGLAMDNHFLKIGSKRGDFCYHLNGTIGTIDDDIREVPINVECDPRVTCDHSTESAKCEKTTTVKDILTPFTSPKQPYCRVYNTIPYAKPNCEDGRRNQDETGIDCGGSKCQPCPTLPPVGSGSYIVPPIKVKVNLWNSDAGRFDLEVKMSRSVSNESCWQFNLLYPRPLSFTGDGSPPTERSVWGNGRLVSVNNPSTGFVIQRNTWDEFNPPKAGKTLKFTFNAYRHKSDTNSEPWSIENLHPLQLFFDVQPLSDCETFEPLNKATEE